MLFLLENIKILKLYYLEAVVVESHDFCSVHLEISLKRQHRQQYLFHIYVTLSAKTVLIGTFSIMRKTNLKYSSCCGSVVLDFSHARFTV